MCADAAEPRVVGPCSTVQEYKDAMSEMSEEAQKSFVFLSRLSLRYQTLQTLNHGSYGEVKFARRCDNDPPPGDNDVVVSQKPYVAVRVPDAGMTEKVATFSFVLSGEACKLRHRHVLRYSEFVIEEPPRWQGSLRSATSSVAKLLPVMEPLQGPDLFDWLRERQVSADAGETGWISEAEARLVIKQTLRALTYLHEHSPLVVHRDVKPENLRWGSRRAEADLKLLDFGLAYVQGFEDCGSQRVAGTALYAAPEALTTSPAPPMDLFSLGVVLFLLLAGRFPHAEGSESAEGGLSSAGVRLENVLPWHLAPEGAAQQLAQTLLEADPARRGTAASALTSAWISEEPGVSSDKPLPMPRDRVDTLRYFSKLAPRSVSAM